MAASYLLDTNVFRPILKTDRDSPVTKRFYEEVGKNSIFYLCPVTLCEVLVGLHHLNATAQLRRFAELIKSFIYIDIVRPDWEEAGKKRGLLLREGKDLKIPDVLIAVLANRLGATIVTDNEKDFEDVSKSIENWIQ